MEMKTVTIENPEQLNFILGQSHFIKTVEDIYEAIVNPVEVIIAESALGRGILGVIDGFATKGIEGEADIAKRKSFLRAIGYKM